MKLPVLSMTDRHMTFTSMSAIVDIDRHEKKQKMQSHYYFMLFTVHQNLPDHIFCTVCCRNRVYNYGI